MINQNKQPYRVKLTKVSEYEFPNKKDMLGFVATVTERGIGSVEITTPDT